MYPEVSLKDARERRDEARKLLANGIDPSANRKAQKTARADRAANSFESVAREWFARYSPTWAATHAGKIIQRLEKDVFPWLGSKPIAEITAPQLLTVLRRIENRGALDTAHRAHQNCGQIFRYGIATGRCDRDPAADLRGALAPAKHEHFASLTEPAAVGELLRAIDGFRGTLVVQSALRLAPLLFVRPGELRKAEWDQFDFEKREWRYVVTKTKSEHLVPLAKQAVAILQELQPLTGSRKLRVPRTRPQKADERCGAERRPAAHGLRHKNRNHRARFSRHGAHHPAPGIGREA